MVDSFIPRVACNSYILKDKKNNALLVDPGYSENHALLDHIEKLGVKIKAILITHGHFDHIEALEFIVKEFPNCVTYICEDEVQFLDNPKFNLSRSGNRLCTFVPKNLVQLQDYEQFDAVGYKITMIKTPFHTKGSCCYYLPEEKVLFSGDTLFFTTIGRTDLPTGSPKTVESSLAKLKKLPDETKVYPGHGVSTTLGREKKYNAYLRNI